MPLEVADKLSKFVSLIVQVVGKDYLGWSGCNYVISIITGGINSFNPRFHLKSDLSVIFRGMEWGHTLNL